MQDPALTGVSVGSTGGLGVLRTGRPAPLTRAERVRRFGVDCTESLDWPAGWEPGGEYVKLLTVKNVSGKAMTIKYRLPESKFFNMAFPEKIKLTPGLAHTLRVRPPPSRLFLCRAAPRPPQDGFPRRPPLRAAKHHRLLPASRGRHPFPAHRPQYPHFHPSPPIGGIPAYSS